MMSKIEAAEGAREFNEEIADMFERKDPRVPVEYSDREEAAIRVKRILERGWEPERTVGGHIQIFWDTECLRKRQRSAGSQEFEENGVLSYTQSCVFFRGDRHGAFAIFLEEITSIAYTESDLTLERKDAKDVFELGRPLTAYVMLLLMFQAHRLKPPVGLEEEHKLISGLAQSAR
ncbi:hypothetical protein CCAX7_36230 [Capsulimonas corticalis]|uniref:Uncharacterized protein n=1 Tax=Capsulimonas corticalis TaxID=2219043 RepID=A0A402D6W8_9BACT|nr:hypothetical protein [Capsulimonas corticalis]BDI31572.1 hypothetical protein CCAX7_36230 [Capsulimonas corticalis]